MTLAQPQELEAAENASVVNDFSITVATVNGSGSQTSNLTILRALFKMGIPVSGKNLFPSNIQGLPTWYTIRVSKDGYLARREEHEIVVAMNSATFAKDLQEVVPGGAFLYADDIKIPINRQDIFAYPMPVKQLIKAADIPSSLRDYVANMVYVGVLSWLLEIDMDQICAALTFHFKNKQKPIDMNFGMIMQAYDWAVENLVKQDPYRVTPMEQTKDLILTDGNTAAAIGSIYGGVQFAAWYPITPASSLAESLMEYLPKLRKDREDPTKNTFVVVQAEDELAAIGMAVGAGWAGLRSMTSTSGPGLSLMAEYAGLAYYSETPLVVWDVQRVGPSTGLPTRTAQGDLTFTYFIGHGDTQQVILLPGSVNECFEFGWRSFDIAERLQTPVFVLSDLDFGMNHWISEPFEYPDCPMDRGKVLWEGDLERLSGDWGRYRDVDGDGIPYRTLPGNRHPRASYFARGTGHDENARYSEDNQVFHDGLERLKRKYETAVQYMPKPKIDLAQGAEAGVISFGSTDPAIVEARHYLDQADLKTSYLRLRALPFTQDVETFIQNHKRVYVVEMNRDGQLYQIMCVRYPALANKLRSIAFIDGLPLTASYVHKSILAEEVK
jgi:2-oxoglutarate ferredoxin oxidoreductase subunit alpha